MKFKVKVKAKSICLSKVGHEVEAFEFFEPSYNSIDIKSGSFDLMCTILGYEFEEENIILLKEQLDHYLQDCLNSRILKEMREKEEGEKWSCF